MFYLYDVYLYTGFGCLVSHFGREGGTLLLISSVPGHCFFLLFYVGIIIIVIRYDISDGFSCNFMFPLLRFDDWMDVCYFTLFFRCVDILFL